MFPNSSGAVAGIVGGVGTVGGIVYPLIYSAPWLANFHLGYSIVAISMIPIVLLAAWVFRPDIAEVANTAGFVGDRRDSPSAAPSDD
jgi:NNP family nitrate/nitrite transporter-like MFS transporter